MHKQPNVKCQKYSSMIGPPNKKEKQITEIEWRDASQKKNQEWKIEIKKNCSTANDME